MGCDAAGQVDGPLSVPVDDERLDPIDVRRGERSRWRTCHENGCPDHARTQGTWQFEEALDIKAPVRTRDGASGLTRERIEGVGVIP